MKILISYMGRPGGMGTPKYVSDAIVNGRESHGTGQNPANTLTIKSTTSKKLSDDKNSN